MHKEYRAPSDSHDVILLDLDGVVYLGGQVVKGAPEALAEAGRAGLRRAFVTNNASRTPGAIAAHLTSLGVPADAPDVVTSSQAAARLIAERVPAGSRVLVVGGIGLRTALREHGLEPVSTAAAGAAAVVQGYAPDVTYGLLAEGALAVRAGALFVAANPDLTMPTVRGELPGNGSMAQVIQTATGTEPAYAGKPEPPLYREAVLRTGARDPLIVGDRLETDVEGANRMGADAMVVLTGVTTPLDLLMAPPRCRPAYIAEDLSGLFPRPVPIVREGETWSCGGWTARWAGRLELAGTGGRIDGLRVACAAAWSRDGDVPAAAVREASEQLA